MHAVSNALAPSRSQLRRNSQQGNSDIRNRSCSRPALLLLVGHCIRGHLCSGQIRCRPNTELEPLALLSSCSHFLALSTLLHWCRVCHELHGAMNSPQTNHSKSCGVFPSIPLPDSSLPYLQSLAAQRQQCTVELCRLASSISSSLSHSYWRSRGSRPILHAPAPPMLPSLPRCRLATLQPALSSLRLRSHLSARRGGWNSLLPSGLSIHHPRVEERDHRFEFSTCRQPKSVFGS